MTDMVRGRLATAVASLCLLVALPVEPASATLPVASAGDGGGGGICANCGTTARPNTQTTTGSATRGSAVSNGNGSSNTSMTYSLPNDGGAYSGTSEVIIKDANGTTLTDITGSASDFGNGGSNMTGLSNIYIPTGGSIYINVIESNLSGSSSFSGSWRLSNYQP